MDSQEQYEALLKTWGFEDRSVERQARRQKIARSYKAMVAFFKSITNASRKSDSHATSH